MYGLGLNKLSNSRKICLSLSSGYMSVIFHFLNNVYKIIHLPFLATKLAVLSTISEHTVKDPQKIAARN